MLANHMQVTDVIVTGTFVQVARFFRKLLFPIRLGPISQPSILFFVLNKPINNPSKSDAQYCI